MLKISRNYSYDNETRICIKVRIYLINKDIGCEFMVQYK